MPALPVPVEIRGEAALLADPVSGAAAAIHSWFYMFPDQPIRPADIPQIADLIVATLEHCGYPLTDLHSGEVTIAMA